MSTYITLEPAQVLELAEKQIKLLKKFEIMKIESMISTHMRVENPVRRWLWWLRIKPLTRKTARRALEKAGLLEVFEVYHLGELNRLKRTAILAVEQGINGMTIRSKDVDYLNGYEGPSKESWEMAKKAWEESQGLERAKC